LVGAQHDLFFLMPSTSSELLRRLTMTPRFLM
jgi:hypothetical protein